MASNSGSPPRSGLGWVTTDKSPVVEPLFNAEPGAPPPDSPELYMPSSSPAPDPVEDDSLPRTPAKNRERVLDDPPFSLLVDTSVHAGSKGLVQEGKRDRVPKAIWSPSEDARSYAAVARARKPSANQGQKAPIQPSAG